MKRSIRTFSMIGVLTLAAGLLLQIGPVHATTINLDPKDTYLLLHPGDLADPSVPIDLVALGFNGGDSIALWVLGDFSYGPGYPDTGTWTMGVFSASDVLLQSSELNRVQDAIDAGLDWVTEPAGLSIPTDIPEDFLITATGIVIEIPFGAHYLFVSPWDNWFSDNHDPNQNYALGITAVPEPATMILLGSGLAALAGIRRRFKKA